MTVAIPCPTVETTLSVFWSMLLRISIAGWMTVATGLFIQIVQSVDVIVANEI